MRKRHLTGRSCGQTAVLRKMRTHRRIAPGERRIRRTSGYFDSVLEVEVEQVEVRLLRKGARPPQRTRPGDAGYDLACCQDFELEPGESAKVPTGFALAVPEGIVGLICPRSGLAANHRVTVVNGPGVVDANFRGECCVLLINLGRQRFVAKAGDRVAQLVLVPNWTPQIKLVAELPASPDERGVGGFGSSGR